MSSAPGKEPFMIASFVSQRTSLRLETTAINETFRISRIVVFAKKIFSSFPG